jgi:hypothetical protein
MASLARVVCFHGQVYARSILEGIRYADAFFAREHLAQGHGLWHFGMSVLLVFCNAIKSFENVTVTCTRDI